MNNFAIHDKENFHFLMTSESICYNYRRHLRSFHNIFGKNNFDMVESTEKISYLSIDATQCDE